MKKLLLYSGAVAMAALVTGCAGFEQSLSTLGPSGAAASLLGTWTSSSSIGAGVNACTNFQWKVTAQQGNALSGEFSAVCGATSVSGTVSGQVNGSDVPYQISGTAASGGVSCSVSVSGTAHIEGDAIRVPYSGTTCLGPTQGEEVLRRPAAPAAAPTPASAPAPPPAPAPPQEPPATPSAINYHVGPGALTAARAERVVNATTDEFVGLVAPRSTEAEGVSAAAELLRRMVWHLQQAGFQAGRQRNPSGAISSDKLTIYLNGSWHAFDVFRSVGTPGVETEVIFLEVFPPNPLADGGLPD